MQYKPRLLLFPLERPQKNNNAIRDKIPTCDGTDAATAQQGNWERINARMKPNDGGKTSQLVKNFPLIRIDDVLIDVLSPSSLID